MDSAFDDAASGDDTNPKTVELIKPAAVVEHFQNDSGVPGTGVVAVLDELRANQPATGSMEERNGTLTLVVPEGGRSPGKTSSPGKKSLGGKGKSFLQHVPEAEVEEIEEKVDAILNSGLLPNSTTEKAIAQFLNEDPKLVKLLKRYDTDGNGEFDMKEISNIMNDLIKRKEQVHLMRKVVAFAVILILFVLASNTALTLWMLNITKVVDVNNARHYLTDKTGNLVVTDKPRYYVSISDLPSLPPKALNALSRLSFVTTDGSLHNYDVQGIEFGSPTNDSVSLFFTSSKKLVVTGKQAIFKKVEESGQLVTLDVATDKTVVYQRRLQMVKGMNPAEAENLAERCSLDGGVCYHTFSEMMHLNGKTATDTLVDAEVDVYGNRRSLAISDPTVTYGEITADAVALTADSRSALGEAGAFLKTILSSVDVGSSNTVVISFHMLDRCINYDTLAKRCTRPAPMSQVDVSTNATDDPYNVPPFYGLGASDGKWYFDDEIYYSKDTNTVQLRVRYAHDPLKDRRVHVVLVDRNDPTHIVSYDEVLIDNKPTVTNFKRSVDDKGNVDNFFTNRRLQLADDAFMRHVSAKLAGFPEIIVSDELLGENADEHHGSLRVDVSTAAALTDRRLGTASNLTSSLPEIVIQTKFSSESYCSVPLTAEQKIKYDNKVTSLPGKIFGDVTGGVSDPMALFYSVNVESVKGFIQWPVASMSVPAQLAAILPRAQLQAYLDNHMKASPPPNAGKARVLSEVVEYNLYVGDELETKIAESSHSLRGENSADDVPEFLQHSQNARETLKKHLEAHKKAVQAMHSRMHSIRTEGILPTRAQCDTVKPTTQPTPSAVFTQKPTSAGDPQYSPYVTQDIFRTQKSQWDNRQIGQSAQYLFQKYVSQNKRLDSTNWYEKIPSYSVTSLSSECSAFNTKWSTFLSLLADYQALIEKMLNDAQKLLDDIDSIKTARDFLYDLVLIRDGMVPLILVFSKIPYVGGAIKAMFDLYDKAITKPVKPIYNEVNGLQQQIDKRGIVCKIQRFITYLHSMEAALTMISKSNVDMQGLVIVDNYCPSNVVVKGVCTSLNTVVGEAVTVMQTLKEVANTVSTFLVVFAGFARIFDSFVKALDMKVLSAISSVFGILGDLLLSSIGFWWPDIQIDYQEVCVGISYPCGVKRCSRRVLGRRIYWPCGVQMCGEVVCTEVPVPILVNVWVSFTVQEIIDQASAIEGLILDAMTKALEEVVKKMGIVIPSIPIPGLPVENVVTNTMNQLDSLDLDVILTQVFTKLTDVVSGLKFEVPYCSSGPTVCYTGPHANMFLAGYDQSLGTLVTNYKYTDLSGAQTACSLSPQCGGLTFETDTKMWTMRNGLGYGLLGSPSGEISYLKTKC